MENARLQERSILKRNERGELSKPTVLRLLNPNGTRDIDAITRRDEYRQRACRFLDAFDQLLMELMLVDHPEYKALKDSIEDRFVEFKKSYLGGEDPDYAGTWVYYPSAYSGGLLIRILRADDHYRLRTSRNIGLFTLDEQNRLRQARIAVGGLSVGGVCATTLAMEGISRFYLTDFDTLACSNVNRLPTSISMLGVPKTSIVANKIWDIDPFAEIQTSERGYCATTEAEIFEGSTKPDVFVDAMDSLEAKIAAREACRRHGVPLVWMTDLGDGLVQIGCERYDKDRNYPAFHGRLARAQSASQRPLNYVESIFGILDMNRVPYRMADSFRLACNNRWPGIPQLAGTVAMAAGATSLTVRKVLLGEDVVPEYFVDINEAADPQYVANRAVDRDRTLSLVRELVGGARSFT